MSELFTHRDLSLESQWRSIILFGKNTATYKFAFAKALLEVVSKEKTVVTLDDLAPTFVKSIVDHLKLHDKQGSFSSSTFLDSCRDYINGKITQSQLHDSTVKLGFVNVVDAFQNVNGQVVPARFYEKNYSGSRKEIVVTDNLLKMKELYQYQNLDHEVEARWNLVETAWNLGLNPSLIEVNYDSQLGMLYMESDFMSRVDITSVRDALNGYQKGKCFYSFKEISVVRDSKDLADVDHFLPHVNKRIHAENGANINGVWNLVLADKSINREKSAKIPEISYLERLHKRNEFYISSKHPLAETIINQTGKTTEKRIRFLQKQYDIAREQSIARWKPSIENTPTF